MFLYIQGYYLLRFWDHIFYMTCSRSVLVSTKSVFKESSITTPNGGLVLKVIIIMDVFRLDCLRLFCSSLQVMLRKRARRNLKSWNAEWGSVIFNLTNLCYVDDDVAGWVDPKQEVVQPGENFRPGWPVTNLTVKKHLISKM